MKMFFSRKKKYTCTLVNWWDHLIFWFVVTGLCSWVVNIVGFYNVYCDVEPKRRALEGANADLAAAEEKLGKIKSKIKVKSLEHV